MSKGWHKDTPGHREAALKGSHETSLKDTLRQPMEAKKEEIQFDIKQKIDAAETIERSMGKDYPRAETLRNWMVELRTHNIRKLKTLTEDIDHYIKVGLGWGVNEPQELQDAIKAVYDYAIEKRKNVIPEINTQPIDDIIIYFNQFQSMPYTAVHKNFVELRELLGTPWKFGLYEETQFYTPKQEINWEIKMAKNRLKKDVFGLSEIVEKKLDEVTDSYKKRGYIK